MKEINLFWHLNNITNEKITFEKEEDVYTKTYSPFMMNRYVSTCEMYMPFIAELNCRNIPKEIHNRCLCSLLPKRKVYFDYSKLKTPKDENSKYVEYVSKYFEISTKDANHYMEFLDKKTLDIIMKKYTK